MAGWREYLPHPGQFGIFSNKNRKKVPIAEGFKSVQESLPVTVAKAKRIVERVIEESPEAALRKDDLDIYRVNDIRLLYNRPTERLMYESPHHVRHFVGALVLSSFLGDYANTQIPEGEKMDIHALQLASMTHDGFRSQMDVTATIINLQLHGVLAAKNLEQTIKRIGWEMPQEETFHKVKEINRYHDVDMRPLPERSREVEFFNMIDKMELVRLFHTKDMPAFPYRIPGVREGIQLLAKRRLQTHEGNTGLFLDFRNRFLPVAEALYQLSMENIRSQRAQGKEWDKVDQFEAVMGAAAQLGMIKKEEEEQVWEASVTKSGIPV